MLANSSWQVFVIFFRYVYRSFFVKDFFKDPTVLSTLKMFTKSGEWQLLNQPVHDIRLEQLSTNVLSLEFFDRLVDNKVVREGGQIRKCIDEYKDEFIISDELRKVNTQPSSIVYFILCKKVMIMDEDESYDMFSEQDRKEFIFQ
jgi:hypothetical protein